MIGSIIFARLLEQPLWRYFAFVKQVERHPLFEPWLHRGWVWKERGKTAHIERWNLTLRQRLGRYVRETLSFSKSDAFHHMVTKGFIIEYNLGVSLTI